MSERQRRIVQLLGSLHDHLPSPEAERVAGMSAALARAAQDNPGAVFEWDGQRWEPTTAPPRTAA